MRQQLVDVAHHFQFSDMLAKKYEKHLNVTVDSVVAIDFLFEHCVCLSKAELKRAMQSGAVWLTRGRKAVRLRRAKKELVLGDEVHLYYDESILNAVISPAKLISDEIHYSVWNKPCGMFSQGTKWGDHSSICRWVAREGLFERPTFLVHRLDRATHGLILVAHSKKTTRLLASLFESQQIEKHYTAVVAGEFPSLAKSSLDSLHCMQSTIEGKKAVTKVLDCCYDSEKDQSKLLLKPETGRKHQIRIHLATQGFPIVGDRLYGKISSFTEEENLADNSNAMPDLKLTACYLKFTCPASGELKEYKLD